MSTFIVSVSLIVLGILSIWLLSPRRASAHCDSLDGPLVTVAKDALEAGNVTPLLKWVTKDDEHDIREFFQKTLTARSQSPEAKELVDGYFLETLVRIHRASEGEPYTGLKPAGQIAPAEKAADQALEVNSVDELVNDMTQHMAKEIRKRFALAVEKKQYAEDSVEAGREYVEAYVIFLHYIKGLHEMIAGQSGHHHSSDETHGHHS